MFDRHIFNQSVKAWVEQIGPKEAMKRLVNAEVGFVTADLLVNGRYFKHPRSLLFKALKEEMAKDGLTLNPNGTLRAG